MHSSLKRKIAIGASGAAVAAFAGGAYAATNSGSNPRQQFLNDVAGRLHVSPQQLQDALKGAFIDRLNAAVAAGKITQAQANAIKQRIAQGKFPLGLGHRAFGPGHLGFGGPGGPGGPGRFGPGGRLGVVAKYLNETPAQLFNQLRSGKSLADVAKAQGKSVDGLKTALTDAAKARLDKAVANKVITSAQEQQILSRLSSRLDTIINRKGLPAFHGGLRRGGGGPGGWGGPGGAGFPAAPLPPGGPPSIVY